MCAPASGCAPCGRRRQIPIPSWGVRSACACGAQRRAAGRNQPGTVGTTSVGAYQAYIAGVGYLNRWILDSAHTQFNNALSLDSTFALAHYKLALVYGWESPGDPEGARHANLASRLGTGLPARERLLGGYASFANNSWADACRVFEALTKTDSTDVEAWYNLGECSYHDVIVVRDPADSTRMVFRSSWNTALQVSESARAGPDLPPGLSAYPGRPAGPGAEWMPVVGRTSRLHRPGGRLPGGDAAQR